MRRVIIESPFAPQTPLPKHQCIMVGFVCKIINRHGFEGVEVCLNCSQVMRAMAVRKSEATRNMRYLRACLADSLKRGEAPFASHGLYTQPGVLDDAKPEERTKGIAAGFAWREAAHATVFYTDLGWSGGMRAGEADAKACAHAQTWSGRPTVRGAGVHELEYRTLGSDWDRL